MTHTKNLSTNIGGISLKNPIMTASGTFGYAKEFESMIDLDRLGGIIVKGLSLAPASGNPPPRIAETPCGMLNAIGLENVGLDAFIKYKLKYLSRLEPPVIINIYGKSISDYAILAERMNDLPDIAGIEVNISCPNVKAGGIAFGVDPVAAHAVISKVRKAYNGPLIVKLSPNVTDVTVIAQSVIDAGADALSLINTLTGMAVDIHSRKPKLANITGGLSGPAIKPVALRMVWQVARMSSVPVIGIGGIMTAEDALEFLMVGASAVQVGTANLVNPGAVIDIIDGIETFMSENQIFNISDVIGSLEEA